MRLTNTAKGLAAAASLLVLVACGGEPTPPPSLETRAETILAEADTVPGVAFAVLSADGSMTLAAAGVADTQGRAFTASTPIRIASNTKTFVAAAALRLYEQGALDLDAPVEGLLDPDLAALLVSDGYDLQAITPRLLLMHSAGIAEHADDTYAGAVMQDPTRVWTRADQVAFGMENTDPVGAPGERFSYSDTGYVLLGDIMERISGAPLHEIVRRELKLDELDLSETWWERFEEPPAGAAPRARQYLDGYDITDVDASMDLYGGGGLVSSPRDMARFMAALFNGEVFEQPGTLSLMTDAPGQPTPDRYRLGVFIDLIGEDEVFSHSGFWGTYAAYAPSTGTAAAGVVLDPAAFRAMRDEVNARVTQ